MPSMNAIFAPIPPLSVANGGTDNTVELLNGEFWIGNTGTVPTISTLTAGSGINITNGPGSITIGSTSGSITWQTSAGQPLEAFNGYIPSAPGSLTYSWPNTTPNVGDIYNILGTFTVVPSIPGTQFVYYGGLSGDTITTTDLYGGITLVCTFSSVSVKQFNVLGTNGATFLVT